MFAVMRFAHEEVGQSDLKCFVTGDVVPATPQEYVRQDCARTLVENYGFPISFLRIVNPPNPQRAHQAPAGLLLYVPERLARVCFDSEKGEDRRALICLEALPPWQALPAGLGDAGRQTSGPSAPLFFVRSNGKQFQIYRMVDDKGVPVEDVPSLEHIQARAFVHEERPRPRPTATDRSERPVKSHSA